MTQVVYPLKDLFREQSNLAWEILECEANLQIFPSNDGKQIATLLSLYMRAVETLNSIQDRREQFFKSRMSSLMMRPKVIKSINKPEFQKRTRCTTQPDEEVTERAPALTANSRKQHLSMQLAYHNEKNCQDELLRMLNVEYSRSDKLKKLISQAKTDNLAKIDERIRQRKQKAFKSRQLKTQIEDSFDSAEELTTEQLPPEYYKRKGLQCMPPRPKQLNSTDF